MADNTTEDKQIAEPEVAMLGMYRIGDPEYPKIKVGKYIICRQDATKVWIQTEEGEGGAFSDKGFEKVIHTFYQENF